MIRVFGRSIYIGILETGGTLTLNVLQRYMSQKEEIESGFQLP